MIQAYNYLLGNFPVKREVVYPAKNRKELKKVYDDIVSLSNRTPVYKIDLSQENQEYTIGIKETALELKHKLSMMQLPEVSEFQSKKVSMSDEDILTAELLNEDTEQLPDTIEIKVNQLANVQINQGRDLLNASFALPMGEYKFNANVSDESFPLTYYHSQRMSNQDSLKSIANFLNQSVPGILATVENGKSSSYSRLTIASERSGRFGERKFAFDDNVIFGEGIVDFFGMNRTIQSAEYSDFVINGVERQTATNTFHLDNVLQVTLKSSGEQPTTLRIVPNSEKILNVVNSVANSYNDIILIAGNRSRENHDFSASKLISEMKSMGRVYNDELTSCGLQIREDGLLVIDESRARQAAEEGSMEKLFTRENGFMSRLLEKAKNIAINPMEYLEKTIVFYPNSEKSTYNNPYITSMYSGMLFSSYC